MPGRVAMLLAGSLISTICYALTIRAHLGLGPLFVLQDGIAHHAGIAIGTAAMVTGFALVLAGVTIIFTLVTVAGCVAVTPVGERERVFVALKPQRFAPLSWAHWRSFWVRPRAHSRPSHRPSRRLPHPRSLRRAASPLR